MRRCLAIPVLCVLATTVSAQVAFEVASADGILERPRDGRIVVYLVGPDRELARGEIPATWDFLSEPMPLVARDVDQFGAGQAVVVDGTHDRFRTTLADLAPGKWVAQAVFDFQRISSDWSREPGNLASEPTTFVVEPGKPSTVQLKLSRKVGPREFKGNHVEEVVERSRLLSDFRGQDVFLRAGVTLPLFYNPSGSYGVVYEVPGFGGDHFDALDVARDRQRLKENPPSDARLLALQTFHIVLDPESPNGHTLFADSDVNGPCGRALVEELIPAIESRFPAIRREARSRLLRGHSSGGWSVCWLQTSYPDVFGGAWASSPDPIDFRAFEQIDLYAFANAFSERGRELPSVRDGKGTVVLSVRDEITRENVIGPANTGGQQWQSWQAVFGTPAIPGRPKPLFDVHTGLIDAKQRDAFRRFDLSERLRADPDRLAPVWRERVRVLVGDADNFYLQDAVRRFKDELDRLPATGTAQSNRGYLIVVPGATHYSIFDSPEMRSVDRQMLDVLKAD